MFHSSIQNLNYYTQKMVFMCHQLAKDQHKSFMAVLRESTCILISFYKKYFLTVEIPCMAVVLTPVCISELGVQNNNVPVCMLPNVAAILFN